MQYDFANQFDWIQRSIGTHDVYTDYTFDKTGRLASLKHGTSNGAANLAGYDWQYYRDSTLKNVTNLVHPSESVSYHYDASNQLEQVKQGTTTVEDYDYDPNGNRSNHTVGDNNQVDADGTYTYNYDDRGNRIERLGVLRGVRLGIRD